MSISAEGTKWVISMNIFANNIWVAFGLSGFISTHLGFMSVENVTSKPQMQLFVD